MKQLLNNLIHNKLTSILVAVIVVLIFGGALAYKQFVASKEVVLEEVELNFDPEGPYALILPRRDGNAINLNIKRVSSFDQIGYELTYQSEGIDRGVTGTINTDDKKSEYLQEILFGTCSKGDTFSTLHCVFDKDVENGTLLLKITKNNKIYKMNTTWHFQRPDVALGKITSGDNHFRYVADAAREELALVGFSAVNDLTGAPKLPADKQILGKVYSFNVPLAKEFPSGKVLIELRENPPAEAQIARFNEGKNEWELLETQIDNSNLTAQSSSNGIFTVLVDKNQSTHNP